MKIVTITGLKLQFDSDYDSSEFTKEKIEEIIKLVNNALDKDGVLSSCNAVLSTEDTKVYIIQ